MRGGKKEPQNYTRLDATTSSLIDQEVAGCACAERSASTVRVRRAFCVDSARARSVLCRQCACAAVSAEVTCVCRRHGFPERPAAS
ncbi:hypothetical protein AMELA_G00244580 [Ameiurus melas]|uniref:Uncharacterized protein n=1 Tax=Ameiurus melas TaxID=219545 RepID=A0A7J5ZUF0_AMEME|nr:hypothetical protein AMELA_G00244580 [Ameiurus melas]